MTDEKGNFVCPDSSQETRLFPPEVELDILDTHELSIETISVLSRTPLPIGAGK
jgi:hypothetical protein